MDSILRNKLRLTVIDCRQKLEQELGQVLSARYGIHPDHVEPDTQVAHLDEAGRLQRQAILDTLEHYQKIASGSTLADAVERYVRECAYTVLNRLAALKMMEHPQRVMIQPSVGQGIHSKGFTQFVMVSPELMRLQADGGYRLYLELLFDALAHLLGPLFDRDLPQSILFPGTAILSQVLNLLNQAELEEVWTQDETIGWIYQFFTPKELRDQARKASASPRNAYELAFRNQFFTPRYVVEFLVDNTLGRLWWEMQQGDTALAEKCRYLVRPADQPIPARKKRDPRTLRGLDPASGSGHFLLYAFDLFEVIYLEAYTDPELGPALQLDFPTQEEFRRAIPGLILKYNLHGIEIDRRAAQIAALAVWLRAQRSFQELGIKMRQRPRIERINIVVAEPMPVEQDLQEEFLSSLENRAVKDVVLAMVKTLQNADEIGSLLKAEQVLQQSIMQAERAWLNSEVYQQGKLFEPEAPMMEQGTLDLKFLNDKEFWERRIREDAVNALRAMAQDIDIAHPARRQLFAHDAESGFALIELLLEPFDCVWMNPPFGAASKGAKSYIEKNYPRTKNDLYAAFVERGLEILRERGLLGAISSRTGFFLTSFREWREELLIPRTEIHAVADLGYGVLDTAMVETAAYVLEKRQA